MQYGEDRWLFRCIRDDENPEIGLFSKNPKANIRVEVYVKNGTDQAIDKEKNIIKSYDEKSYNSQFAAFSDSLHVIREHIEKNGRFVICNYADIVEDIGEENIWEWNRIAKSIDDRKANGLKVWGKGGKDICQRYHHASRELDVELKEGVYIKPEHIITVTSKELERLSDEFCKGGDWHRHSGDKVDKNDWQKDRLTVNLRGLFDTLLDYKINKIGFDRNNDEEWENREKDLKTLLDWGWRKFDQDFAQLSGIEKIDKVDNFIQKKLEDSLRKGEAKDYEDIMKEHLPEEIQDSFLRLKEAYFSLSRNITKLR